MLYNFYSKLKNTFNVLLPIFIVLSVVGAIVLLLLAAFGYKTHLKAKKVFKKIES